MVLQLYEFWLHYPHLGLYNLFLHGLRIAMETHLIPFVIQTYDAHIQYLPFITKGGVYTLGSTSIKSSALIMLRVPCHEAKLLILIEYLNILDC